MNKIFSPVVRITVPRRHSELHDDISSTGTYRDRDTGAHRKSQERTMSHSPLVPSFTHRGSRELSWGFLGEELFQVSL